MEIDLPNLIITIVVSVVICGLSYTNIALRAHNKKVFKTLIQSEIDREALITMLTKVELENENKNGDGFLKFVSDSRDWAFQYIERVQISIKTFQNIFHPISVRYYKDKTTPIDQEEFGKLFEAYKKLIEELPEEGKSS
jgi:hypothetical protein